VHIPDGFINAPTAIGAAAAAVGGIGVSLRKTAQTLSALELCPRAVVMNGGAVVADGPTAQVLADAELMAANRLELPYGFDPSFTRTR